MTPELVVDPRFCGPPGSGNGGYVAGRLATYVEAPVVEVRLAAPPPLGRPLRVVSAGDGLVELREGGELVALAQPGALDLDVPRPVSLELARAAFDPVDPADHPFPTCFGCGPLRSRGDALRHMPGPVDGREGLLACPMTTDPALPTGEDGALAPEVVWAALDCPSASGCVPRGSRPHVLGTFTVQLQRPIPAGSPHVVMAWGLGADGRKKYGASAIVDADGTVCAIAAAVWIELLGD